MHRVMTVLMASVAILGFSSLVYGAVNPHHEAYRCRANYTPDCDWICQECHLPPYGNPPSWKVDIHSEGDKALCERCHSENLSPGDPGYLLPGHHPTNIYYEPLSRPGARLITFPEGPKLICDPKSGRCKVMCSTCHNPMGNNRSLHRVKNTGAGLCLSCHNM